MKKIIPLILLVEDNEDVLMYIKMVLEHNDCNVITAKNGKEALETLEKNENIPDLIISDIMMPEMDGYEFFKAISDNKDFGHIPFIFLSALDSPEDVRLGKLLGADDYLTKPIDEDDLTATVAGKILRAKKNRDVIKKVELFLKTLKDENKEVDVEEGNFYLIEVLWDDLVGPKLYRSYPEDAEDKCNIPLRDIGAQIYDAATSIYGQNKRKSEEGVLIHMQNYRLSAYAFFSAYKDKTFRGGERDYMYGIIAPRLCYYNTLLFKEVMQELSERFKQQEEFNLKPYWQRLLDMASEGFI